MAQSTVIEGVVRNADTKELLPYVLLRIAGTNTGAQANSEGEYRLVIPQSHADADIIVSCAEMLGGDSVLENASLVGVLQTNYFDANAFSDLLQKCHAGCQDVGTAGFGSGCLQQQYLPCGR